MVAIVKSSYLNLLLVFIPVSWALYFARPDLDIPVFVTSFIAIIPLAALLGFATEELSLRVALTYETYSNMASFSVELIVAIIALLHCELEVVQSSLVGSVLSNLLLVLGMCFFAGGVRYYEQGFAKGPSQLNSSLLVISVIAVMIPAAVFLSLSMGNPPQPVHQETVMRISHGVAIVLLLLYVGYLFFQLRSHTPLYADESSDSVLYGTVHNKETDSPRSSATVSTLTADVEGQGSQKNEPEGEKPQINKIAAVLLLVVSTALVAVTSEALVDSIDGIAATGAVSKEFIGLILLPIVSNAAEHFTAVTVSVKDKLNLSISIAVGSSIQIALFVIPFIVTLAWIVGKPLPMVFDPFETIVLFLAVLTVNYTTQDGKANYMEGMVLMGLFIIIATASFFYTGSDITGLLGTCVR
ncbi:calcium/proton exchanger [Flagelloscypha sp. PMI_526]|nr:calcium/proton exchanger [Flagelloscypha sp. PMI_526]